MTQQADFEINGEDLLEPVDTVNEEQHTQPSLEVPPEVIQQGIDAYHEHIKGLINKFGEEELKEFYTILEGFEAYADDCDKISREASRKNELVNTSENQVIDYNDPRVVLFNTKVASAVTLLDNANKLPEEFVARVRAAENKCFVAQTRILSIASLEHLDFQQLTQQVDNTLLQGIYSMAAFQFENVLRTLQNLRREGTLDDSGIDQYIINLEKIRDVHMNYLTFHDLSVDVLLEQYSITLEVISEIRVDKDNSSAE